MNRINEALDKLLAANSGPVSIVAGVAALRATGVGGPDEDLQSIVGTFAAERGRAISFDRWVDLGRPLPEQSCY
ncbi:hypothetical protein [Mesorhizobium sp. WSM4906]|uniref:hypothetical protein n=1 Tax=Mesorhizobium sp. WSM4906 TaxID=3038546 RepID=UPI002416749F|nr:hypothetical protein [Mesorhizobium sp. WSM4906]WFP74472.1 hypothetical protein QAZ22_22370 [Mesorhizobium sp. WSM4906]